MFAFFSSWMKIKKNIFKRQPDYEIEYKRESSEESQNKKQNRNLPYWVIYISWTRKQNHFFSFFFRFELFLLDYFYSFSGNIKHIGASVFCYSLFDAMGQRALRSLAHVNVFILFSITFGDRSVKSLHNHGIDNMCVPQT
jgi:hypothetical protein